MKWYSHMSSFTKIGTRCDYLLHGHLISTACSNPERIRAEIRSMMEEDTDQFILLRANGKVQRSWGFMMTWAVVVQIGTTSIRAVVKQEVYETLFDFIGNF